MDASDAIRARIPSFPAYTSETGRRLSDELIRSYVGEAVAEASARLDQGMSERVCALLMRAGFINQTVFVGFEYANVNADGMTRLLVRDLTLCSLADKGRSISAQDFDAWISSIEVGFDARDAVMSSLKVGQEN